MIINDSSYQLRGCSSSSRSCESHQHVNPTIPLIIGSYIVFTHSIYIILKSKGAAFFWEDGLRLLHLCPDLKLSYPLVWGTPKTRKFGQFPSFWIISGHFLKGDWYPHKSLLAPQWHAERHPLLAQWLAMMTWMTSFRRRRRGEEFSPSDAQSMDLWVKKLFKYSHISYLTLVISAVYSD